jgi:putative DNA-invertase from lambdoid prophage Rac
MTMAVINAVAEFERDLLIERTQAELKRAMAEGKKLGRPKALSGEQQAQIRAKRSQGVSLGVLARRSEVSHSAIERAEK